MIKFRIITDSSCGISQEEANNLGVVVLPLTLTLNGKDYKDGIDISTDDFYNLLFSDENKDFPKTSMRFIAIYYDCLIRFYSSC